MLCRQQVSGSVAPLPQGGDGRAEHRPSRLLDRATLDDYGYRIDSLSLEVRVRHIDGEGFARPFGDLQPAANHIMVGDGAAAVFAPPDGDGDRPCERT